MICRGHGWIGVLDSAAHLLHAPVIGPFRWLHDAHNRQEKLVNGLPIVRSQR